MADTALDQLIMVHQKIKAHRAARKALFDREDEDLKAEQALLRQEMLKVLNSVGGNSVNTKHGTVYRTEKVQARAADWNAIWAWMKEHDAPELLERRVKTTFVTDYMEHHEGQLPAGIDVFREFDVSVRKPSN